MDYDDCKAKVESFAKTYSELRTGWHVFVYPHDARPYGREGSLVVEANMRFPNSSPEDVKTQPTRLAGSTFVIKPDEIDNDAHLAAVIVLGLLNGEVHELREFVRFGDEKFAPLHPHREDGIEAWAQVRSAHPRLRKVPTGA